MTDIITALYHAASSEEDSYGVAMECQGFINGFSIALDMLK